MKGLPHQFDTANKDSVERRGWDPKRDRRDRQTGFAQPSVDGPRNQDTHEERGQPPIVFPDQVFKIRNAAHDLGH